MRRRQCTGKKTAVVMNMVGIMEYSTSAGGKVRGKIAVAAGMGIMVCTEKGTTTVVADAVATSITEQWDSTGVLFPAKKSPPDWRSISNSFKPKLKVWRNVWLSLRRCKNNSSCRKGQFCLVSFVLSAGYW
jgi:hypothetical protein